MDDATQRATPAEAARAQRSGGGDPDRREPVRYPWLWVAMVVVVLAGVPLYLPSGSVAPLVGGIPLWLLVCVAATVAFSALISWACLHTWNLVEPEEEAAGSDISSAGAQTSAGEGHGTGPSEREAS